MKLSDGQIKEILERGVSGVIEKSHLEKALKSGKKLRIKFGIDPTSPDLHLGHAVPLRKLKQFQDAGHDAVLIIGDFTARIGDPSGREDTRKPLSPPEIKNNLKKYLLLAGKIINIKKAKKLYNSKWLAKADTLLSLAKIGSIQYVMRRNEFRARQAKGQDIAIVEAMYPLFQGYDSVKINADVEIGGVDQELNLLAGRKLQKYFGQKEQDILMMPLLLGTDGARKMSKGYGNYIALDESPDEMFAKIMTVPDSMVERYFLLLTDLPEEEIRNLLNKLTPLEFKKKLAIEIVASLNSTQAARKSKENFENVFQKKEIPENLQVYNAKAGETWANFLLWNKFALSRTGAKRLITGGAVEFNGVKIEWPEKQIAESGVVKIGKYKFIKVEVR